jgi:hypothetical protein
LRGFALICGIIEAKKKLERLRLAWPDVGPDTEFVGNPVTIKTTDGESYGARVDIPRGDPALSLTDVELLANTATARAAICNRKR